MTPCACLGPMYGEPYCLCRMQQLGLPLNEEARAIEHKRAVEQLKNLNEWFEQNRKINAGNLSNQ